MTTFNEIEDIVSSLDPNLEKGSDSFKTAVLLWSAAIVGSTHSALKEFTNYSDNFIEERRQRLEKAGVFKDGVVYANWTDEEEGFIEFWLDVSVAEGLLEKSLESEN